MTADSDRAVSDEGPVGEGAQTQSLETRLQYVFRDAGLLRRALTHTSYRNENDDVNEDNERLEFLGDSVVGCAVSHLLWEHYPNCPEGELTRYRALLVSADSLARTARGMNLGSYLLLGRGEEQTGGRQKVSVLADAFESIVAALYLDGGFDVCRAFLARSFKERVKTVARDHDSAQYKAKVQELVQGELRTTPRYRVVGQDGPDHLKIFDVALCIWGSPVSQGRGRSKKDAEEDAARSFFQAVRDGAQDLEALRSLKRKSGEPECAERPADG